jgi:hypothetical protein
MDIGIRPQMNLDELVEANVTANVLKARVTVKEWKPIKKQINKAYSDLVFQRMQVKDKFLIRVHSMTSLVKKREGGSITFKRRDNEEFPAWWKHYMKQQDGDEDHSIE